jgi:hypothetical protein
VIAPGAARNPAVLLATGGSAEIVGIELVETRPPDAETGCSQVGREFVVTECAQDLADQRWAETVRKLAVVLFMT